MTRRRVDRPFPLRCKNWRTTNARTAAVRSCHGIGSRSPSHVNWGNRFVNCSPTVSSAGEESLSHTGTKTYRSETPVARRICPYRPARIALYRTPSANNNLECALAATGVLRTTFVPGSGLLYLPAPLMHPLYATCSTVSHVDTRVVDRVRGARRRASASQHTLQATDALNRLEDAGRHAAQHHLPTTPPLDVAFHQPHTANETLCRVGGRERPAQPRRELESEDGEGLVESFAALSAALGYTRSRAAWRDRAGAAARS